MNIVYLNKQFDSLSKKESAVKFLFEPQMQKQNPSWKRHIYFNELKYDFMSEISAYGFSPYIHQTFDSQRKNKCIMKYQNEKFNHNLIEYIRKQNKKISMSRTNNGRAKKKVNKMHSSDNIRSSSSLNSPIKKIPSSKTSLNYSPVIPHEDFLSNALKKIAMSSSASPKHKATSNNIMKTNDGNIVVLNNDGNEDDSNAEEAKKIAAQKKKEQQVKQLESLRGKYIKSLKKLVDIHPVVVDRNFDDNDITIRKDYTLLRKYEPEFNKTNKLVGLIKRNENPAQFAFREREKERLKEIKIKEEKMKKRESVIQRIQPNVEQYKAKARISKSAFVINKLKYQSDLLHRARKSSEIIFSYY